MCRGVGVGVGCFNHFIDDHQTLCFSDAAHNLAAGCEEEEEEGGGGGGGRGGAKEEEEEAHHLRQPLKTIDRFSLCSAVSTNSLK